MHKRTRSLAFRVSLILVAIIVPIVLAVTWWHAADSREMLERQAVTGALNLSEGSRQALRSAMLDHVHVTRNVLGDLSHIAGRDSIRHIRIYGRDHRTIRFSTNEDEIGRPVDVEAEECAACHGRGPSAANAVRMGPRHHVWRASDGERRLVAVSPVRNEPACSRAPCHANAPRAGMLGMLAVDVSLAEVDREISVLWRRMGITGVAAAGLLAAVVALLLRRLVGRPVRHLVGATRRMADDALDVRVPADSRDEMGELGRSFNAMAGRLQERTADLRRLSAAIDSSINVVFITDRDGRIQYVNRRFTEVSGYSAEEAVGQTPRLLKSGETPHAQHEEMWRTILAGGTWRAVIKNRTRSGGSYWADTLITPVAGDDGDVDRFLAIQEDVTQRMRAEERAEHLAWHDGPTGLANRARFIEVVDRAIRDARAAGGSLAVAVADLDRLQLVNDSLGHATGDEQVRRVGKLLGDLVASRPFPGAERATAARLGGDEFAVLLPGLDALAAREAAERIRAAIEGLALVGEAAAPTASLGVALFPAHGGDVREILAAADAALFRAKQEGRNRCHVFQPEDRDLEKMRSQMEWRDRIQHGLAEGRFVPWFQPILDLADGGVHHYEALARLRAADGGIAFPGAFIETAERFGLVGAIDRAITVQAMRAAAAARARGTPLAFGANLSGGNLGGPEMLSFLESSMRETGAEPGALIFEITETAAIRDMDRARGFVHDLRQLGCRFALDDFGVGFTSFAYLKEIEVDYIKIDGAFIRRLPESPQDRLFVRAMADVARGMGIGTIAEFVENRETIAVLVELGVDCAQGYAIGKPSPDLLDEAALRVARSLVIPPADPPPA